MAKIPDEFRDLFEKNLAGVYVSTLEGTVIDCNQSFADIFGYGSREELLSLPATTFYQSPTDRERFISDLQRIRSFTNKETLCRRKDGSMLWVLENVALVPAGHGQPERIQGTLVDITERKAAESALVESESKFRAVADTAHSAIYIHDGNRFLYVNHASAGISGYAAEEEAVEGGGRFRSIFCWRRGSNAERSVNSQIAPFNARKIPTKPVSYERGR